MNPTTNLTISIFNPEAPYLYTVLNEAGQFVEGFATIQQVQDWLKLNAGGFVGDPVEVQPDVYQRKAQISTPAYNRMLKAQAWAEKRAA